jgi:hypothetical protein
MIDTILLLTVVGRRDRGQPRRRGGVGKAAMAMIKSRKQHALTSYQRLAEAVARAGAGLSRKKKLPWYSPPPHPLYWRAPEVPRSAADGRLSIMESR